MSCIIFHSFTGNIFTQGIDCATDKICLVQAVGNLCLSSKYSKLKCNQSKKIIELFDLRRTLKDHLVQALYCEQCYLSLDWTAQSSTQPGFEHFRGWSILSFSGQSFLVSYHLCNKRFLPFISSKLTVFSLKLSLVILLLAHDKSFSVPFL